jgi:hypothetical protein
MQTTPLWRSIQSKFRPSESPHVALENGPLLWEIPDMTTATVDDKQRVRLKNVKPGVVLAVQENADGTITLAPVKADMPEPSPPAGLKPFTKEEADRCWGKGSKHELDALESHCAALPVPPPEE